MRQNTGGQATPYRVAVETGGTAGAPQPGDREHQQQSNREMKLRTGMGVGDNTGHTQRTMEVGATEVGGFRD